MRIFYFIIILLVISVTTTNASELPIDFEAENYAITNFDGGELTIIDNQKAEGINTSAKVAQMVKHTGEEWAGSYITLNENIDFSAGKIFKMKVYSPKVGANVLLKVQNPSNTDIYFERELSTTSMNQWEELSFNFGAIDVSQSYREIVLIFDMGTVGDGSENFTYLIDDITLVKSEGPTESAPAPTVINNSKVISIFSDAFNSIDGTNFNPYWQQTTVGSIEELEDGEVLKLVELNYQGIELPYAVNAAAMKYLHVDVWTANETSLEIYPISQTTGEKKADLKPLYPNEWSSFDIKLADLVNANYNLADLHQFKFMGAGGNTVYIDNLYLYDDDTLPDTEKPIDFSVELGTITYNSIELLMNASDNSGAINYIITVGGNSTVIGAASGIKKTYEFTRLPSSTEFTFEISATDTYGNEAEINPITIVGETLEAFPAPTLSSPTPTSDAAEVISIFSDSYTNVENTNFNPYWRQNTWFTSEQVGGNEVLKYENFNYQGIEFGSAVDASNLSYLHLDIWTPNESFLEVSPISASSGEKAKRVNNLKLNEWNSVDIALSAYTSQGLSIHDIVHLKLVGSGKSIIYVDNIYFHTAATSTKEENITTNIQCYPNPVFDKLYIENSSEITNVDILDISGQKLSSFKNSGFDYIDCSKLNSGCFFVVLKMQNGDKTIQKIVKK